jgi:act minimal PKS acyl carrier protein
MNPMTLDDLEQILVACAGASEVLQPGTDLADYDFEQLGYDSLALMETAAKIESRYGVAIDDEAMMGLKRPQDVLEHVNATLLGKLV